MENAVLLPPIELGGQCQAGGHGLAAPGNQEKDGGIGLVGELKGQMQAGLHEDFIVFGRNDIFKLSACGIV